jgi:predicted ATPase
MDKGESVRFRVITGPAPATYRNVVLLRHTGWDDWFKFSTLYNVTYVDADGAHHDIGGTKIGRTGLLPAGKDHERQDGFRYPDPPERFRRLGEEFFSLGQDASFYEALTELGGTIRDTFLKAMRDIAYDPDLLRTAAEEEVTRVSLLREVPIVTVREQLHRLAHGGARLTPYKFTFRLSNAKPEPLSLRFSVDPKSRPPSNIQVLIGRNGVGKSTLLNRLAKTLVEKSENGDRPGIWNELSNLVSVSFSAFDEFEPIRVAQDRTQGLTYHYIGLKKIGAKNDEPSTTKDFKALSREMTISARVCSVGARQARWLRALRLLEADPIFADAGIADLVEAEDKQADDVFRQLGATFKLLSSGHKIVLLTITRLVETVEEKSLVLLDEPEAHLHPPLLSAFVRALSDLLTNRNGMAIIATHSPVVLQEVPRSCVWKLHRSGHNLTAERPQLETFGENVGTLTDDVFGLEVTATGFHTMLAEAAAENSNYEQALATFDGQLGAEGRAILRAMLNTVIRQHVGR